MTIYKSCGHCLYHDGRNPQRCSDCGLSTNVLGKPSNFAAAPVKATLPPTPPVPTRAKLLQEGLRLTTQDRNDQYGDPLVNMGCAGELKAVFRKYNKLSGRRVIGPAELEAIDMVMTKLSRIAAGGDVKADSYIDGAVYLAAAGENAEREAKGELKDG